MDACDEMEEDPMTSKTRAWQFRSTGGPEKLELVDHDLPSPGPGEAMVRIEAIGLNRADLLELAGFYFGPPPSPSPGSPSGRKKSPAS